MDQTPSYPDWHPYHQFERRALRKKKDRETAADDAGSDSEPGTGAPEPDDGDGDERP
jgi:hypothetical protein